MARRTKTRFVVHSVYSKYSTRRNKQKTPENRNSILWSTNILPSQIQIQSFRGQLSDPRGTKQSSSGSGTGRLPSLSTLLQPVSFFASPWLNAFFNWLSQLFSLSSARVCSLILPLLFPWLFLPFLFSFRFLWRIERNHEIIASPDFSLA